VRNNLARSPASRFSWFSVMCHPKIRSIDSRSHVSHEPLGYRFLTIHIRSRCATLRITKKANDAPYPPAHAPNAIALNAELPCANITAAVDNPMLTPSARNRITPIHNFTDRDITMRARQSFLCRRLPTPPVYRFSSRRVDEHPDASTGACVPVGIKGSFAGRTATDADHGRVTACGLC
jgi:hypothetical protein